MSKTPTFCAVMPNYNDAENLPRALGSLFAQVVPFDRILVINDGSTDDSLELLAELQKTHPNLYVHDNGKNIGIMDSVNRGLTLVDEDYVFLVSANDYFEPEALALAKAAVANGAEVGLIGGKARLVEIATGEQTIIAAPLPDVAKSYDARTYMNIIRARNFSFYGGSVFVHRTYALAAGGFRAPLKWHSDWFLFALLATRHGFAYAPAVIGNMTLSPTQYSRAIQDWSRQKIVVADYIRLLKREYPSDYHVFRAIGLLPSYDLQAFWLLLRDPELRSFLTPLLVWRLLFYKLARIIGRLIPRDVREKLRGLLRV